MLLDYRIGSQEAPDCIKDEVEQQPPTSDYILSRIEEGTSTLSSEDQELETGSNAVIQYDFPLAGVVGTV